MRIGEVADAVGLSTKTLRFYEQSGLLPAPARSANGYRDYQPEILPRLEFIARGRTAGLTLAQLQQILSVHKTGQAPCGHVRDTLNQRLNAIDDQIEALTALRATIAQHHDTVAAGNPDDCNPEQVCSYLGSRP